MRMTSQQFRQRMHELEAELREQGVSATTFAPPAFRMLWRLGFKIRPPLYQPIHRLAGIISTAAMIAFGGSMWLMLKAFAATAQLEDHRDLATRWPTVLGIVGGSLLFGCFFGREIAESYSFEAKRLHLPPINKQS